MEIQNIQLLTRQNAHYLAPMKDYRAYKGAEKYDHEKTRPVKTNELTWSHSQGKRLVKVKAIVTVPDAQKLNREWKT